MCDDHGYDLRVPDGIHRPAPPREYNPPDDIASTLVNGSRRFSQAISEGDGISLLAPVTDAAAGATAEADGAEAVVVERMVAGLREATGLPILLRIGMSPREAVEAGADAYVLRVDEADDEEQLHALHLEAEDLGIEPVVRVSDEEELALVLERIDPEVLLLSGRGDDDEERLESVLDLLPDVPAGKLAIAEVPVWTREDVVALERAGIDGVIVAAGDVARLVGGTHPEV